MREEFGGAALRLELDELPAREFQADVRVVIRRRVVADFLADGCELLAGHCEQTGDILLVKAFEVAADEALEEHHVVVGGNRSGIVE